MSEIELLTPERFVHPLVTSLRVAVPMLIMDVQLTQPQQRDPGRGAAGWPWLLEHWRRDGVAALTEQGDALLYRQNPGETAKVFGRVAKALAALSFHRCGYRAFGLIWCAEHSPGGTPDQPEWYGICQPCFVANPNGPGPDCPCCPKAAT